MNDRKVLVTGGAGFIGSHLVDALLDKGCFVRVLDNLSNGSEENLSYARTYGARFEFIKGSILDEKACTQASEDVDYVFHLACLGVRHSIHRPFENHQVNAEGTLKMLNVARQAGVKHFFYISTSEVFGRTNIFPIHEHAPTEPLTVYGASKLAGEHYTHAYFECYGFPATVLRIFNNFGPRAHYEGDAGEVIPRSIVRILYNQQPIIFGNGEVTRDFFYVKDTADVLCTFMDHVESGYQQQILGQVYNVGTGVEVSMKKLITQILVIMNQESLGILYMDARPADVPRLWVDTSKFQSLLNYKPEHDFNDGMEETISYYQKLMKNKDLNSQIIINNWEK